MPLIRIIKIILNLFKKLPITPLDSEKETNIPRRPIGENMEALIWGFKFVLFILVSILAVGVKALKLILAPILLLIFGGFKVGGVLGLMMIIMGAAIGFGAFSFFAAAKTYYSRTY